MDHLLEIDSVQLSFGERMILNNIYIQSKTGRITGILGRNGCGKSCLLKLVFGEIKTNEKSVCINGEKLFEEDRDPNDMRMLPQFNFLPKHLKVVQAFKFFDIDFETFSRLFPDFLDWRQFKIKHLSGGNIRIVETYLILKSKTKFSILDEPFSHLTPRNCEIFIDIMQQEKANKGIIITDHLHRYITQASDDLYVIKDCVSYKVDSADELKEYGYLRE
jgi:ABC-type multidrug transport system ATPase subunit